jgi:hypothetical protein
MATEKLDVDCVERDDSRSLDQAQASEDPAASTHEDPPVYFGGYKPKPRALPYWREHSDDGAWLFGKDVAPFKQCKSYVVAPLPWLYKTLQAGLPSTPGSYYENVEHGQPVRVFGDIDYDLTSSLTEKQWNQRARGHADAFISAVASGFVKLGLVQQDVVMPAIILRSYQPLKMSLHIIFPALVLSDIRVLRHVMEAIDMPQEACLDMNPYMRRGLLRTIWSTKMGKPARSMLQFMEGRGYVRPEGDWQLFTDTLITNGRAEDMVSMAATMFDRILDQAATRSMHHELPPRRSKTLKQTAMAAQAQTSTGPGTAAGTSPEDVGLPLHKYVCKGSLNDALAEVKRALFGLPQRCCENYLEWRYTVASVVDLMQGVSASAAEQLEGYLHEWSQQSSKYEAAVLDQKIRDRSMHMIMVDHLFQQAGVAAPFTRMMRLTALFDSSRWGEQHVVSERYLPLDLRDKLYNSPLAGIKAGTGEGKTTMVDGLVHSQWQQQPVLAITVRRKQADNMAATLKLPNYQAFPADEGYIIPERRLVLQVESLMRADPTLMQGAVLVLDEVHALLDHFTSDTFKDNRRAVFQRFLSLIQSASRILLLDADLMDHDIDFVRMAKGLQASDVTVVHNTFANKAGVKAVLINDPEDMVARMQQAIDSGDYIYAGFTSRTTLEQVRKRLDFHGVPPIVHHAGVQAPLEVDKWKESHVMVSPQVVHAVSGDWKDLADRRQVFEFVDNALTMNALEVLQQCNRIRHFSKATFCVLTGSRGMRHARPEQALWQLRGAEDRACEALDLEARDRSRNDPLADKFEHLHMHLKFIDDNLKTDTAGYILELLHKAGYEVSDLRCPRPEDPDKRRASSTAAPLEDAELEQMLVALEEAQSHGTQDRELARQLETLVKLNLPTAYLRTRPDVWRAAAGMIMDDKVMSGHFNVCALLEERTHLRDEVTASMQKDFMGMLPHSTKACGLALLELGHALGVPCGFAHNNELAGLPKRYTEPLDQALTATGCDLESVEQLLSLVKRKLGLDGKRWQRPQPPTSRSYGSVVGLHAAALRSWFGKGSGLIRSTQGRKGRGKKNTGHIQIHNLNKAALVPHLAMFLRRWGAPSDAVRETFTDACQQAWEEIGHYKELVDGQWLIRVVEDE